MDYDQQKSKFCSRCITCNSKDIRKVDKKTAEENNVPKKSLECFSIF